MAHVSLEGRGDVDVVVVGAGLAGAAAALGFAQAGFTVASCGAPDRQGAGRTVALFGRSIALLRRFGVWEEVEAAGSPLRTLRLIDATGSLFAPRPVEFRSQELGLEAFGWNVENARLAEILGRRLETLPGLERFESPARAFAFEADSVAVTLADSREIRARLAVGADGKNSQARKAAGLDVSIKPYGQSALTLFLRHTRPHEDVSTEFHTRQGPFTLVPLPPAPGAPFRSSLVWLMSESEAKRRMSLSDAALESEIERQSLGLLGSARIEAGRSAFPMVRQIVARLTGPRLALAGDAAHAFPPIGAQGLNLGLRDVEGLVGACVEARGAHEDIGSRATLGAYERARRADIGLRNLAVNGLNLSLLAPLAPVDALRGFGLATLGAIGPLRRFVMREGLSPSL